MAERLPSSVVQRFKECLITGAPTTEEDSHRAVGGMLGAYKQDTMIDLEFASKFTTKPMKASGFLCNLEATLPSDRLFQGETDGSSFPNGGLRVTHSAAAFTTWDRSSPPFVLNKTLYIPCAFITHFGKCILAAVNSGQSCIDEKTPLLRSMDAVKKEGLRLLKASGLGKDVAPGQHEMSPVFRVANVSCDTNVLFMEARNDHRLGAQEAPPAIISLYPGQGALFEKLGIYSKEETAARQEAETMIQMVDTAIVPACVKAGSSEIKGIGFIAGAY
eukprot:Skav221126  [mRNA]  locus=scaffold233:541878:550435:- [translate_table: standard]